MRVLVDTSVWVDHLHRADTQLQDLLGRGCVWTHAVVIGELAAGRLANRQEFLRHMRKLPRAGEIDLDEGLHLIEARSAHGRGLSWADIQMLAAASIDHLQLWSRDKALAQVAADLGISFQSSGRA